jgi:diguanylate cyclase (GGDEF)-like protein
MQRLSSAARSFAVLIVERGKARISRFRVQVCGETLWATGPEGLAERLASARPDLIAVAGDPDGAEALAEDLRRQGLAESVFVVTRNGKPGRTKPGQVPVPLPQQAAAESSEELLNALVEAMVSAYARFPVSPLTGMPSSAVLRQEVETRLARGEPFAFLYLDLDNFKAYNDVYGFGRGDIAITTLGREVQAALARYGTPRDLAVHIGGDDFAVLTAPERAHRVATRIIAEFSREAARLYPEEARTAGYIETRDRQGTPARYPLMTVSVGGVNTAYRQVSSYLQLTEIAAEIKAHAKSKDGGTFIMDRRRA